MKQQRQYYIFYCWSCCCRSVPVLTLLLYRDLNKSHDITLIEQRLNQAQLSHFTTRIVRSLKGIYAGCHLGKLWLAFVHSSRYGGLCYPWRRMTSIIHFYAQSAHEKLRIFTFWTGGILLSLYTVRTVSVLREGADMLYAFTHSQAQAAHHTHFPDTFPNAMQNH